LDGLTRQDLLRIILAYEPVWAIGTGRTASPETAQEMHRMIREWLSDEFGRKSQEVSILYGGSVKPDNIERFECCSRISTVHWSGEHASKLRASCASSTIDRRNRRKAGSGIL